MRAPTVLIIALALLLNPIHPLAQETRPPTLAGRSAVYAPRGVVATSHPLASAAGLAVLQRGGNAIDAAVTAAAVLSVVEPFMTGVGGDAFALIWLAEEGRLVGLNASGKAGALMTRGELARRGHQRMPLRGPESITIPGALSGWAAMLERCGTISLAEALEPAIRLAEEGFPVSPVAGWWWHSEVEVLKQDEGARTTFLVDGIRAPRVGEWFRNLDFARSLRTIAEQGPEVFYGGELGQRIVDRVHELGGFLTLEDLKNHRPEWVEPISVKFHGYRVWELPPNGQGVAVLEMLRTLEPYDLAGTGHNSAAYLHHLIEAKKLAFADLERYVADPNRMDVSPAYLLSDRFIRQRREQLDPRNASKSPRPGPPAVETETTYLTAADARGNMVSFINSLGSAFGSGVVVPGTGFALQNRGVGFTLKSGHPNTVGPGKRPFHTIIPAFVTRETEDGRQVPWLSYGVIGGSMQPQGHVQVFLNIVLFGMDIQQAIDAPRFRHLDERRVALEAPIPDETRRALEKMGHEIADPSSVFFGGGQAIMHLERGWVAGSEPRLDGAAMGY